MILTYDGTFDGLLTAVFEGFRLGVSNLRIEAEGPATGDLFSEKSYVETSADKAGRVRQKLEAVGGKKVTKALYRCFLSEQEDMERIIVHTIQRLLKDGGEVLSDYRDPLILRLQQIGKQIGREVHRMHAFVRFQETKDGLYVSLIEPDFNVLPLIGKHFRERYPAQDWLIYDVQRHYGLLYDRDGMRFTTLTEAQHVCLQRDWLTETEKNYQELWKTYFKAVDIPERRNMKLHVQHVPKRYWKYLIEKV
jgi:probable DNA metabolism protein